jgi:hypothetical protein
MMRIPVRKKASAFVDGGAVITDVATSRPEPTAAKIALMTDT